MGRGFWPEIYTFDTHAKEQTILRSIYLAVVLGDRLRVV